EPLRCRRHHGDARSLGRGAHLYAPSRIPFLSDVTHGDQPTAYASFRRSRERRRHARAASPVSGGRLALAYPAAGADEAGAGGGRRRGREEEKKKKEKRMLGTERGIETMFRTSYMTHINLSGLADSK